MSYVTKTEVEKYTGLTIADTLDTFIATLIGFAEDYVELYCGNQKESGIRKRRFEDDDAEATRRYDGTGSHIIPVDDLRSVTSLTIDGDSYTVDEDFYLYPLNAEEDGEPYTHIELVQPEERFANANPRMNQQVRYIFENQQRVIAITGTWGYSTTPPDAVKVAVLKLVGGVIKENVGDTDLKELTQESLGEYSATFAKVKDVANVLGVNAILDPYKRKKFLKKRSGVVKI